MIVVLRKHKIDEGRCMQFCICLHTIKEHHIIVFKLYLVMFCRKICGKRHFQLGQRSETIILFSQLLLKTS